MTARAQEQFFTALENFIDMKITSRALNFHIDKEDQEKTKQDLKNAIAYVTETPWPEPYGR